MSRRRTADPNFDPEEIENQDPLGEQAYEEEGFRDAKGGEPDFNAPVLEDDAVHKRPGGLPQKVAGIPEEEQKQVNSPSLERPDSQGVVIRERGGASKGDPAVGGTRPK